MNWSYLTSESLKTRYRLAASYLQDTDFILEIGGYLTPISQFLDTQKYKKIVSIDPLGEEWQDGNVIHLKSKYQDVDIFSYLPRGEYALLILGMDLGGVDSNLVDLIKSSKKFIVEYPIDIDWNASHSQMLQIIQSVELFLEISIDIDCAGNNFGDLRNSYPPRTTRRFSIFKPVKSNGISVEDYLEVCKQKNYSYYALSKTFMCNPAFLQGNIFPYADFHESHEAIPSNLYLGTGIIYYSLASALKANICVCLGSGGWFVPRLMRQAQRDNNLGNSRTILVDANIGNYGRPNYMSSNSFLRMKYPDIEIINMTTEEAFNFISDSIQRIDFLHIDADHSFNGSYNDYKLYSQLCDEYSVITFHDTRPFSYPKMDCWKTLHLIKQEGNSVLDLSWIGEGLAIIQPKDNQSKNNKIQDADITYDTFVIIGTKYASSFSDIIIRFGEDSIEKLLDHVKSLVFKLCKVGVKTKVILCKEFIQTPSEFYRLEWMYGLTQEGYELIESAKQEFIIDLASWGIDHSGIDTDEMSLCEINSFFSNLIRKLGWIEVELLISNSNMALLIPIVCRTREIHDKVIPLVDKLKNYKVI